MKPSNVSGILAKLLPRGHRAQVLGDLEERGFQWRDIASTIPSAWIAHLRRDWIAPVPNLGVPATKQSVFAPSTFKAVATSDW